MVEIEKLNKAHFASENLCFLPQSCSLEQYSFLSLSHLKE